MNGVCIGTFFGPASWGPGSCPRGRTCGYRGGLGSQKKFFSEIQAELVCELLTSMAHATAQFFGSPPPGEGPEGQIS